MAVCLVGFLVNNDSQREYLPYKNVTVNCDSKGVVIHGNEAFRPLFGKQVQADVLQCMKQYIRENPFEVEYEWVKAHQDDIKGRDDHTLKDSLNCRVDKLAKKALRASLLEGAYTTRKFTFTLNTEGYCSVIRD